MDCFPTFSEKVKKIEKLKSTFLQIAEKERTPLYIFDKEEARNNYQKFIKSFEKLSKLQSKIKNYTN